jgi:hypothetical protein
MSKHSDQVVLGFMRLTVEERADAIKKLNEFVSTPDLRKSLIVENFRVQAGLDLGPLNQGGCRCCGR